MSQNARSKLSELGIETSWENDRIVALRENYYAASQRAFMPYKTPVVLERGQDQYLWDVDGKRYLDLLAMNLCISVGHAHPAIAQAISQQAEMMQHCTTMFYHPVPAHYAKELAATMPTGEDWVVHFTNSGAEAADLALLMARSHTGNLDFLALQNGYHGVTFGAMSMTGIRNFRHKVPLLTGIHHLSNPDAYRGAYGDDTQGYLEEIDRAINTATSGALAGMIVEPVMGYGGIVTMLPGYMKGAFERVRAAGGLAIVDEVQSGFGRTGGNLWAFVDHDVVPDIVIMAKGIGNGIPLAAVVAKKEIAESLADKFYFNTYGANPMACAAGRAVLKIIEKEGLIENAARVGEKLIAVLQDLYERHDLIGDVRGKGLMLAIELVKDRKSKEPATEETARIFEKTRENGLILSKSGANRNILRMVPPLCIREDDVPFFAEGLEASFRAT